MCNRVYMVDEMKTIEQVKEESYQCTYCGKDLSDNQKTIDHVIPLSRGRKTIKDNLCVSCKECNLDKSNMTSEEYEIYKIIKSKRLNESKSYNILKEIKNNYIQLIKTYRIKVGQKADIKKEHKKIESIILNANASVSEGYVLYKEFKTLLIKENQIEIEVEQLMRIADSANEKIKVIEKQISNIEETIMLDIRRAILGKIDI